MARDGLHRLTTGGGVEYDGIALEFLQNAVQGLANQRVIVDEENLH
jgi:hypothetical protein